MDTDILFNDEERLLHARDLIDGWEIIQARRLLLEVLENEPLCDEAYYLLGLLYDIRIGKLDEALDYYLKAVRLNARNMEALLGCFRLLNRCGAADKVLQMYAEADISLSVYSERLRREYAIACEKTGRLNEALAIVDHLLETCTNGSDISRLEQQQARLTEKIGNTRDFFIWG